MKKLLLLALFISLGALSFVDSFSLEPVGPPAGRKCGELLPPGRKTESCPPGR